MILIGAQQAAGAAAPTIICNTGVKVVNPGSVISAQRARRGHVRAS